MSNRRDLATLDQIAGPTIVFQRRLAPSAMNRALARPESRMISLLLAT